MYKKRNWPLTINYKKQLTRVNNFLNLPEMQNYIISPLLHDHFDLKILLLNILYLSLSFYQFVLTICLKAICELICHFFRRLKPMSFVVQRDTIRCTLIHLPSG